ncbi:TetR family transcriptional regulator [Amycolatopsis ultiminotia]|uniref:TetR family transcriptional regulator n=1 Tax=Amycolatopsis ultiminotia TaxID=543629 RepID=A0ABP6XWF3_9PSEU
MASGLRERKRRELRDQLSLTTVLLAKEHGLANVRVEDIVERVGVSRRTFSNYFASKEEAIADRHVQRTRKAAQALLERPAGEPLWDAITAVVVEPYSERLEVTAAQPREEQDSLAAVLSEPDMQDATARGSRVATEELAKAIAQRLGVDGTADILPRLVANAALSTQLATVDFWLRAEPAVELFPLLRAAFARLGAGFDDLRAQTLFPGRERKHS